MTDTEKKKRDSLLPRNIARSLYVLPITVRNFTDKPLSRRHVNLCTLTNGISMGYELVR